MRDYPPPCETREVRKGMLPDEITTAQSFQNTATELTLLSFLLVCLDFLEPFFNDFLLLNFKIKSSTSVYEVQ